VTISPFSSRGEENAPQQTPPAKCWLGNNSGTSVLCWQSPRDERVRGPRAGASPRCWTLRCCGDSTSEGATSRPHRCGDCSGPSRAGTRNDSARSRLLVTSSRTLLLALGHRAHLRTQVVRSSEFKRIRFPNFSGFLSPPITWF